MELVTSAIRGKEQDKAMTDLHVFPVLQEVQGGRVQIGRAGGVDRWTGGGGWI